ncbi:MULTISPECIES: pyridoxamine 5'-phosphate oxidase family protein [unclassified Breznakia]|uniref:pyridoxamine 5'-phosphate oxidase family protein n=1 Tax=unclassified Breznakia TaxID=2623764 RepID=UPI002404D39C|nr:MULTISPECIES: pyridoxamine 5'-phosphate oxidase family protein [unclassified Breznakia]MDF9837558.1 nitroimidazol reductase NimA-like FMN-containing flavoprotein (pyridoxamine 5'-phosphate oxidase superfamily) [Breznakia sp. PFB2-8]MDF9860171.1 nitroimidazol reductase NimA-like FMN-containing flavoprotein (pyridoxamine 5'-phosphate oxidase superfamily) [Breznakia sp. PH5-24]
MFRTMRRSKQILSDTESIDVLKRGTSGVLAVSEDGHPYAIPLSYVYDDKKIFFHCAQDGHKIDAMKKNNKVSFCVIDQDEVVPNKHTTYFRSVIVFGSVHFLTTKEEKCEALKLFGTKYSPAHTKRTMEEIDKQIEKVCVIQLSIEHMSGKEAIELVRERKGIQTN